MFYCRYIAKTHPWTEIAVKDSICALKDTEGGIDQRDRRWWILQACIEEYMKWRRNCSSHFFFFHFATNLITMFSVYTLQICAGDALTLKILYKHSKRMLRPWCWGFGGGQGKNTLEYQHCIQWTLEAGRQRAREEWRRTARMERQKNLKDKGRMKMEAEEHGV